MPMCRGRYSWLMTIVTPNVPITHAPTSMSAIAPGMPPTTTKTAISGAVSTRLPSRIGRRPIRSAAGPAKIVPAPPASSISESRWFPCAFEWPSETSHKGTNVTSPNQARLRKAITPRRTASAPRRSCPVESVPSSARLGTKVRRKRVATTSAPAIARHGSASSSPPRRPKPRTSGVATIGPSAKPMFPPIENADIPLARRRPLV